MVGQPILKVLAHQLISSPFHLPLLVLLAWPLVSGRFGQWILFQEILESGRKEKLDVSSALCFKRVSLVSYSSSHLQFPQSLEEEMPPVFANLGVPRLPLVVLWILPIYL